jgi:hypothetical protein
MMRIHKTLRSGFLIKKALLSGILLVCGAAIPVLAQELVRGTFTLSEGTRFGTTVLPKGRYVVSIVPVTAMTSSGNMVSVFVRPEDKVGPVASMLALATPKGCETTPSGLNLLADGAGMAVHSMCLEKQGLFVDFDLGR